MKDEGPGCFGLLLGLIICGYLYLHAGEMPLLQAKVNTGEQARVEDHITLVQLQAKLDQLEKSQLQVAVDAASTADRADAIAKQVSANARINNENAARDMTRRGACGLEWVQGPYGMVQVNKACTVKDLRP